MRMSLWLYAIYRLTFPAVHSYAETLKQTKPSDRAPAFVHIPSPSEVINNRTSDKFR